MSATKQYAGVVAGEYEDFIAFSISQLYSFYIILDKETISLSGHRVVTPDYCYKSS